MNVERDLATSNLTFFQTEICFHFLVEIASVLLVQSLSSARQMWTRQPLFVTCPFRCDSPNEKEADLSSSVITLSPSLFISNFFSFHSVS